MAARGFNHVILLGRLGADAETRYTGDGKAVSNFSVATSRRWRDKQTGQEREETDWHRVVLWRAEALAQHLRRGTLVLVDGRLQTRQYETRAGEQRTAVEVVADEVILLGSPEHNERRE